MNTRVCDTSEQNRYTRQMMLPNWGKTAQQRLKDATVLIAGAGGLGSPNAFYLACAGVGHLKICDDDVVELSNLNRQILHTSQRIGQNKAASAQTTIAALNPYVTVTVVATQITADNVSALLEDVDVVVDCLDNLQTRLLLNRQAHRQTIPMVHGSIYGMEGRVAFINPPHTPCLQCLAGKAFDDGTFPAVGAAVGVIGSLQALEVVKYITGCGRNLTHTILAWDGFHNRFQMLTFNTKADCDVCGPRQPENAK